MNNENHISTYYASNPEQAISFKGLPEKIKTRYAALLREDIAAEAITMGARPK